VELKRELTSDEKIAQESLQKIKILRRSIHGLLRNRCMTTQQLTSHLMGEPYSIELRDLHLIKAALNDLSAWNLLLFGFSFDEKKTSLEPYFKSLFGPNESHL